MADQPVLPVSFNAARGPCAVCFKPGRPCERCRVDYYCSKEHQTRDSYRHSKGCGALEIRSSPELKRHLVATRDIPAGTVIMRELPLVSYPRPFLLPGQMLCVVCCRQLSKKASKWKQCRACGWPVCDAMCAGDEVHRTECLAFRRSGFKVSKGDLNHMDGDWLNALAALRTCLASDKLPQLVALQDQLNSGEALKNCPDYLVDLLTGMTVARERVFDKTVAWLNEEAGISWIPAETLRRAVALNQLNGCCDDTTGNGSVEGGFARGSLYAGLCTLEYSCVPNTHSLLEVEATGQRLLMVSRDVQKGEHLTADYQDSPFRPLSERHRDSCQRGCLCRCILCEDATELGLYLSSHCCMRCSKQGKMTFIMNECSACGAKKSATMNEPEAEFQRMQEQLATPRRWERFIGQFLWPRGPLHMNHYMVLHAKMQIIQALESSQLGHLALDPKNAEAVRWESLCGDVLRALEVVRPGFNSYMQSVLLATYHVKGLQAFNILVHPRKDLDRMAATREMVKILMRLEKIMIAGSAKDVVDELKGDWKEIYALPKYLFDQLLAG